MIKLSRINGTRPRAGFSFLATSLALIGNYSLADDIQQLDTLVVTATRLPAPADAQPVNLSVITRADILHSTASSLPALLATVAGIHVRSSDSSGNGSIDIRGFGVSAASNTQILLNGIKLNDNDLTSPKLAGIALENIERIEIVKGGAVMYGGGASGGVINILTRSANEGLQSAATLKLGSYQTREGAASLNYRKDGLSLSAEGRNFRTEGYRANSADRTLSGTLDAGIYGEWGALGLQIGSEREDSRLAGARKVDPRSGLDQFRDDPTGTNSPMDWGKTRSTRIVLHGDGRADATHWAFDLTRREKSSEGFFDYGSGYSAADRRETRETGLAPRLALPFKLEGLQDTLSLGMDWQRAEMERFSGSLFPENRAGDGTLRRQAIWLDNSLQLSAVSTVTLGWRREFASQQSSARQYDGSTVRADRRDAVSAWQLGWRQQLAQGMALYAKAGSSFRLPNADELVDNAALKPQTSQDLEAGLNWVHGAWQGRAALYRLALDNEIAFQPYVNGFGQNINLSPTRRQGLELEARWRSGDWDIAANVSWQDATFRSGIYGGVDVAGKRVPLVPRWLANLSAGWQLADATRLDALLHAAGASRLDNDQLNTGPQLDGYSTLDLKLSRRWGVWSVALSGENLTDQRYAQYGIKSTFGPNYNLYPHQGRRWLLSGSASF